MTFDCSTLKPNDICLTRDGEEAEYIGSATNPRSEFTHIFWCRGEVRSTNQAGRAWYTDKDSCRDIISKKPEKRVLEVWVNVYEGGVVGDLFDSRADADGAALDKRIACVHIRQEYADGDGL